MIESPIIEYGVRNVKLKTRYVITTNTDSYAVSGGGGGTDKVLLLENGEEVLLENGSPILLENQND